MHKDDLLNLLTDAEREVARRHRAKTTVQPTTEPTDQPVQKPLAVTPEHTPLPIAEELSTILPPAEDPTSPFDDDDEAFRIDTRELDARVFRKHALNLRKSGAVPVVPPPAPVEAATPTTTDDRAAIESTEMVPIEIPASRWRMVPLYIGILAVAAVAVLIYLNR